MLDYGKEKKFGEEERTGIKIPRVAYISGLKPLSFTLTG
jgi:hypothetical protein